MKIAVATVLYKDDWRQDAAKIRTRLALMNEIVEAASGAVVIDLPAGFFRVPDERGVTRLLRDVEDVLRGYNGAILGGLTWEIQRRKRPSMRPAIRISDCPTSLSSGSPTDRCQCRKPSSSRQLRATPSTSPLCRRIGLCAWARRRSASSSAVRSWPAFTAEDGLFRGRGTLLGMPMSCSILHTRTSRPAGPGTGCERSRTALEPSSRGGP